MVSLPKIAEDTAIRRGDEKIKMIWVAPHGSNWLVAWRGWYNGELQLPELVVGIDRNIMPDIERMDEVHSCGDIEHVPVLAADIDSFCEEGLRYHRSFDWQRIAVAERRRIDARRRQLGLCRIRATPPIVVALSEDAFVNIDLRYRVTRPEQYGQHSGKRDVIRIH
jgi:hypothetical protein